MWPPPLLRDRPFSLQVLGVFLLPIVFGAVCGWLLGESDAAYQIVVALGILGGISAGYEHAGWREGLARGVSGGVLFAVAIVVVHEARGVEAAADLPASLGVMALIYAVLGALFGTLGGWLRARHDARRTARAAGA
jgi:hypothetical protein